MPLPNHFSRSALASPASPVVQACPLNPVPAHGAENGQRILEDFSERFSPAIRGVVEFAKRVPGFGMLSQDDQVTLLKVGVTGRYLTMSRSLTL